MNVATDNRQTALGMDWHWPLSQAPCREADRLDLAEAAGLSLKGCTVLEPGCHDGHLTVELCRRGATVTAFDARLDHVLHAVARCSHFGFRPHICTALASDIDQFGTFDVVLHAGLLYHLTNPVEHLRKLAPVAPHVILDTHTAVPGTPLTTNEGFEGHWWDETSGPLAGVQPQSFWLTAECLQAAIHDAGYDFRQLREDAKSVHGPRSLYLLERR